VFWLSFFVNQCGLTARFRHPLFKQLISGNSMLADSLLQKELENEFNRVHDRVERGFVKKLVIAYEDWRDSPAGREWLDRIRKARYLSSLSEES
jgi:hypothetical protein